MSTEFYVHIKDLDACDRVSPQLAIIASGDTLTIGTSRGNQDRKKSLADLLQKKYGEWPEETFPYHISASMEELQLSNKPYFSKWSKGSPIEFFDTDLRFYWNIPAELQRPSKETVNPEDYQRGVLDFWDSVLDDTIPVYHGSAYHPIDTWKDLKDAIFGEKRYMEPSRFVQGTVKLFSIGGDV